MNIAKLVLLARPTLLASMLLVANPVHAAEVVEPTETLESTSTTPIFEVVFEQETPESSILVFTDEEASAAIDRFGCDCSGCLNAVRQLQGTLPLL